jgi:protoporphyrinogen oxidase
MRDAAIIGGGISGLAAALAVADLGHRVTLFEADRDLGGLGTTFPWRDTHLERFYHCLLPDDHALLGRIRGLGLGSQLMWRKTLMGFMYQRRTWPMNTARDLLTFGPLTVTERLRMGMMGLRARHDGLAPRLDDITAEEWIRSQVGDRAFEILWRPLLSAKIGAPYRGLPALWLSSRMSREKNTGPERKGCLAGGYRSLIDAYAGALRSRGVRIRLATHTEAIEQLPDGRVGLRISGEGLVPFDFAVATLPLVQFQSMTRSLSIPSSVRDLELDYQGVVSGVFLTRRALTDYYWMPWVDSGTTSQGAIMMSNLVPLSRSHGLHVNYLVNYTHRDTELFSCGEGALLERYRSDLERLFPEAARTIEEAFLFRAPFVEPIWTAGYARRVPPTSVIPGRLYLACTAQVYPDVNSWNSCCAVVDAMIPRLAEEVAAAPVGVAARGAVA